MKLRSHLKICLLSHVFLIHTQQGTSLAGTASDTNDLSTKQDGSDWKNSMKIRIIILCLFLSSFSNFSYSQKISKFHQLYQRGDDYKKSSSFNLAEKTYLQALTIYSGNPDLYIDLISVLLHQQKNNEAEKYLKSGILKGANIDKLLNDSAINKKFKESTSWAKIYDIYRKEYNSSIPFQEERLKLVTLLQKDQDVRNLMEYFPELKRDSIVHSSDIENSEQVYAIVKKIGFPDRDKVGEDGAVAMYILLSHLLNDGLKDKDDLEYFEPLIKISVLKGTFEPFWMANLVDRNQVIRGLKQIYGSYWEYDSKSGKRIITPVEQIENVDQKRAEIGLAPLKTVQALGLVLPSNYKN
ncbi:MAG: hypothetical protein P0Y49_17570 [Candidatus Pedobacter colombiensis]|uniref:Tetratricopeptide repeat protein n=1 Tax=Candidatus Pedobacter colombiensis TaxID=3121371 RepID=A0AAJ6B5X9_9SPHI|nr:DUF6624 domain-containing protein [Pedobacter sp.]WEK18600.1 MAG: hypothetical protein P0Y49_17570 [Pedobacter sp.]